MFTSRGITGSLGNDINYHVIDGSYLSTQLCFNSLTARGANGFFIQIGHSLWAKRGPLAPNKGPLLAIRNSLRTHSQAATTGQLNGIFFSFENDQLD